MRRVRVFVFGPKSNLRVGYLDVIFNVTNRITHCGLVVPFGLGVLCLMTFRQTRSMGLLRFFKRTLKLL